MPTSLLFYGVAWGLVGVTFCGVVCVVIFTWNSGSEPPQVASADSVVQIQEEAGTKEFAEDPAEAVTQDNEGSVDPRHDPLPPATGENSPSGQNVAQRRAGVGARGDRRERPAIAPVPLPYRYSWNAGDVYDYDLNIVARRAEGVENTTIACHLEVASRDYEKAKQGQLQVAIGSAFVISENGYLLTCAHVVANARTIDVKLGETTYPAEVVKVDATLDLAVLKVEARGLPTIRLADSSHTELGEDVRAIGFPLASILGDDIKVTRGSISGITKFEGHDAFQIDAAVNPGNSGGPVVNDRSEVIGVTVAKLKDEHAALVGFCIPANLCRTFLSGLPIPVPASPPGEALSGVEVVRSVTPAVAFVKINDRTSDTGKAYAFRLRAQSQGPGSGLLSPKFTRETTGSRSGTQSLIVLTDAGVPLEASGNSQLPYLLGSPVDFLWPQLPEKLSPKWSVVRELKVRVEQKVRTERVMPGSRMPGAPRGGFRPPTSPLPFGPRGPQLPDFTPPTFDNSPRVVASESTQSLVFPAQEGIESRVEREDDKTLIVTRDYQVGGVINNELSVRVTGTSQVTIDKSRGLPVFHEFTGRYQVTQGEKKLEIPLEITAELKSGQ